MLEELRCALRADQPIERGAAQDIESGADEEPVEPLRRFFEVAARRLDPRGVGQRGRADRNGGPGDRPGAERRLEARDVVKS